MSTSGYQYAGTSCVVLGPDRSGKTSLACKTGLTHLTQSPRNEVIFITQNREQIKEGLEQQFEQTIPNSVLRRITFKYIKDARTLRVYLASLHVYLEETRFPTMLIVDNFYGYFLEEVNEEIFIGLLGLLQDTVLFIGQTHSCDLLIIDRLDIPEIPTKLMVDGEVSTVHPFDIYEHFVDSVIAIQGTPPNLMISTIHSKSFCHKNCIPREEPHVIHQMEHTFINSESP
ncbi:hypothetical protein K7432_002598 [Basidiobolus ranarum]|uniref:Uncharacterized protein n=1 Tax=Basidiobolus ranarum TaxID=34480 RepID=A0ABR2X1K4_9FUNG